MVFHIIGVLAVVMDHQAIFRIGIHLGSGVFFQSQFQADVVAEVVFRKREAKRFVSLDCTTSHATEQFYFRLIPKAEVAHRLFEIDIFACFAVLVDQHTVVFKDVIVFHDLDTLTADRDTELKRALIVTPYQTAVATGG